MVYHISDANGYVVVTGFGIKDVNIDKKAWVWPWQKVANISISPFDIEITLQAITMEKLQFSLPAVFTIGPDDEPKALKRYAMLLTDNSKHTKSLIPASRTHVQEIVKGIIEGETRVIISGLTMEEIFASRQIFKTKIIENVQSELDQFGLKIYNANIKELQDAPGSEYFKNLSRKAHEGVSNQARVDVANARMIGEIGEAEKKGKTKQEISKIDAETAVLETKRKSEKAQADAELTTTQTNLNMGIKLAQITAQRKAEARDAELQKDVETRRADMELAKRRATDLVHAKIEKEATQENADASLYKETKSADGALYKQKAAADGAMYKARLEAEAAYYRATKEAEAVFFAKQKEAQGLTELAKAYGNLANVLGGSQGLMQYMMLQNDTYEKLALANAKAINGLQPKITVWNTGSGEASAGGVGGNAAVRNIFQNLPPLFETIQDQTGIRPPTWLAQMPQVQTGGMTSTDLVGKGANSNGVTGH
ncbi:MAG: hypothetical protein MMC33_002354 [Icmadophila ericetorum]|nr:hypothetical protein [Icmadophila ericetorum]